MKHAKIEAILFIFGCLVSPHKVTRFVPSYKIML